MRSHKATVENRARTALQVRLGSSVLASVVLAVAAVVLLAEGAAVFAGVGVVLALAAGVYTTVVADGLLHGSSGTPQAVEVPVEPAGGVEAAATAPQHA